MEARDPHCQTKGQLTVKYCTLYAHYTIIWFRTKLSGSHFYRWHEWVGKISSHWNKMTKSMSTSSIQVSWAMSNAWISFSDTRRLETDTQSVSPVAQVLRFTVLNQESWLRIRSRVWRVLSDWGVKPPPWLRRLAFFSFSGVFSCVCSNCFPTWLSCHR